jgi:alkylated DNA repair protein (DNA oxidative demethylase)
MEFNGFRLYPAALDAAAQARLVELATAAAAAAPFYRPLTPWGKPMGVEQTSFGALGWTTGQGGYRYEPRHPVTGEAWPPVPAELSALFRLGGPDRKDPTRAPEPPATRRRGGGQAFRSTDPPASSASPSGWA